MKTDYEKQANDFLQKFKIDFEARKSAVQTCGNWSPCGFKYDVRFIKRHEISNKPEKELFLNFWGSIADKEKGKVKISAYSVLACLQNYDVGTIWDFTSEFGYEANEKTERIYNAVKEEWQKVNDFFSEQELEKLREIQ